MIRKIKDFNFTHRWIEDVKRIQSVLLVNGYEADLKDCADLWEEYSDDMCAGWIGLPEDDEDLWMTIENRIEKYM